jgi:hypothetical protein
MAPRSTARDGDAPGLRREQAGARAQRGGLAGAVGAEEAHDLPRADLEAEVVHASSSP